MSFILGLAELIIFLFTGSFLFHLFIGWVENSVDEFKDIQQVIVINSSEIQKDIQRVEVINYDDIIQRK